MEDNSWDETVYYKIGMVGSTEEAIASFTFRAHADLTVAELRNAIQEKLTQAAIEVSKEFGPLLVRNVAASIERHNIDSETE